MAFGVRVLRVVGEILNGDHMMNSAKGFDVLTLDKALPTIISSIN